MRAVLSLTRLAMIAALLAFPLTQASATDNGASATGVGHKINDFTLKDTAGKDWALRDCKTAKGVVVVFVGTECPINNMYLPRLAELYKEFEPKGIRFIAINSNRQDTAERVAEHAKKNAIAFPVLKDEGNVVADRFGAKRTPQAFLLDNDGTVRYAGRIDDQFGIGYRKSKPTRKDLSDAIEEVLAGKTVTQPTTRVAGCVISRVTQAKADGAITFSKHVSRIVQKNCQECHRPGQIGPMPLLTYEDTEAWAQTIREVIQEKRMPPWHADPQYGKFTNDRSLSAEDRDTLLAWIDQGCAKGDPRELPEPRTFRSGWRIGQPDVVFAMKEESRVPAKTPKYGVPYKYFVVPTDFEKDMWVQAAEARPGAQEVVHHIIVFVQPPGKFDQRNLGDHFLVGYAPGDMPATFAPGTAKKIPKGSRLIFQMHYTPDGIERKDRSSVGIVFAKEKPKEEVRTRAIDYNRLHIPAGDANYKAVVTWRVPQDSLLVSFLPHMHLRGKSFQYRAIYPDGRSEILLKVPRFDFGWQSNYRLETPVRVPAGTKIECTAHYDNSPGNPNNPDPTKNVYWGDQTWEEMLIGFVDYIRADETVGSSKPVKATEAVRSR